MKGLIASVVVVATVVATIAGSAVAESGRLVVYPAPSGQELSTDFGVRVRPVGGDWLDLDVYRAIVDRHRFSKASMVGFDTDGPVEVAVTKTSGTMGSARVRPLSYGITPVLSADGKAATFTLPQPLNVSFEVNGDIYRNLHVFASPTETDVPRAGSGVIVFGPGRHTIGGDHVLRVHSNTTVYLAGGAVVEGSIQIARARNVVVRGRGIIDPSRFFPPKSRATILITQSTDVGIRDITLLRAQEGGIVIARSAGVAVAGVREITTDPASDGIFVTASRDVLVDDVFLRTSDDSIAVYATTPWYGRGGSRDVTVRNSTLWADVAHPFLAGMHGDPEGSNVIEHVAVQNVDVLEHDVRDGDRYQGALALNAGDRVTVRDVRFDNVRIEDFSYGQVVNLKVFRNPAYNRRVGMKIEDVLFRDVSYRGANDVPSRIRGYTSSRRVTNVTFENFTRNGKTVLDPIDGNVVLGPFAANIDFRTQPATRTVDDTSAAIRYSGHWIRRQEAASHAGDVHAVQRPGSRLAYAFRARQARIIGLTGPAAGKVDVFVDGKYAATVDTYSTIPRKQQIWFDTGVLRDANHVIELRYRAQKNALSAGAGIAFDKLEVVR